MDRKSNILIVEDCEYTATNLLYSLRKARYSPVLATNRYEAEQHLKSSDEIDVIVTDWHIDNNYKGRDVIALARSLNKGDLIVVATNDQNIKQGRERELSSDVMVIIKGMDAPGKIIEIIEEYERSRTDSDDDSATPADCTAT